MIKLVTFCLFFTALAQASTIVKSETNTLDIKTKDNDIEVQLPNVAHQALEKWNPDFKLFNQTDYSKSVLELFKDLGENQVPMTFIEDLDGNGKKDIVLLGSDLKKQYVVAILQKDKKWTLIKVSEWAMKNVKESVISTGTVVSGTVQTETGIPVYVLKAIGEHADKLKENKKAGIQIENFMGHGDVYEIINNKAVKFILPQSP